MLQWIVLNLGNEMEKEYEIGMREKSWEWEKRVENDVNMRLQFWYKG